MKLDVNGVKQLKNEIKIKRTLLEGANKKQGQEFSGSISDDFCFEQAKLNLATLENEIYSLNQKLANVVLAKPHGKTDCVDLGDTVRLYDKDFDDEFSVKLSANYITKAEGDVDEITINSPLGEAIFGKKKDEVVSYSVGKQKFEVKILDFENTKEKKSAKKEEKTK